MVFIKTLKHYMSKKPIVVDEKVTEDCIEFIGLVLPKIKEYLNIESAPFIQLCTSFDLPTVYGLYKFDTKELFICPYELAKLFKLKNYGELFLNITAAIVHELTHYKQDIEGRYSQEKFLNEYTTITNLEGYMDQDIEKEAYSNQFDFTKINRMYIYTLAGIVLNRRLKK